jgi:hypothetical protein
VRKRFFVLLLTAVVVPGPGAFAETTPWMEQIDQAASTGAAPTGRSAPTTLRMRGTIEAYNASTGMLSLSTANGIVQFPISSTARIRQRRDRIDAIKLEKLAGYRVAIRYSESGDHKIVTSVQVFGKDERTKK